MVKATRGLLVNCEASVREILLKLDQTMHFIVEDLDANHLFIDAGQLDRVRAELEKRLAENVYLPLDTTGPCPVPTLMGHGCNLRRVYRTEDGAPELGPSQTIGKVAEIRDKGIVAVNVPRPAAELEGESPSGDRLAGSLAYLPPRFRGVLFIRRGSFVVLSPSESSGGEKMVWTIETLLRQSDIRDLRRAGQWQVGTRPWSVAYISLRRPSQFDVTPTADPSAEPAEAADSSDGSSNHESDQR